MLGVPGWWMVTCLLLALAGAGCASTSVEGAAPGAGATVPLPTATPARAPAAVPAVAVPPASAVATAEPAVDDGRPPSQRVAELVAARPYKLFVPAAREAGPLALVIYLHGFGASAERLLGALDVVSVARERGVVLAVPDGSVDGRGRRFWNAGPACCDFDGTGVDDVAYLDALIDDVAARQPVDAKRVYVVGYSNGGFMAHRLACERGARLAAIVSLSGAGPSPQTCQPSAPVSVLQVHGDADRAVSYGGGRVLGLAGPAPHPSALDTVAAWAARDGCSGEAERHSGLVVSERTATRTSFAGCRDGSAVELWTVLGGGHLIGMKRADIESAFAFLLAHPKP